MLRRGLDRNRISHPEGWRGLRVNPSIAVRILGLHSFKYRGAEPVPASRAKRGMRRPKHGPSQGDTDGGNETLADPPQVLGGWFRGPFWQVLGSRS